MHLTLTKTRRLLVAAGALAALAALPSAAGATTFCVGGAPADCPPGGVAEGRFLLQRALDDAKSSPGPDTVLVAAEALPYEGSFVYEPTGENPVTVAAFGSGRPELVVNRAQTGLSLDQATVRGIDVHMLRGAATGIDIAGGRLEDVTVDSAPESETGTGVRVTGKTSIERTRITAARSTGLAVSGSRADVDAEVVDVRNATFGVFVFGGKLRLSASRVSAKTTALRADAGLPGEPAGASVARSTLTTTGPGSTGVALVDVAATLFHVTVAKVGTRDPEDTGVLMIGGNEGGDAVLRGIALSGYTHGLVREIVAKQPFPLLVQDSVWVATGDELGGTNAGDFIDLRNVRADPALADPASGDLRPRPGSPAIDRDRLLRPSSYVDLDDLPAVDGDGDGEALADAGALEFRPPVPAPGPQPPTGGGDPPPGTPTPPPPGGDRRAPGLSKVRVSTKRVRVRKAKTLRLRFTLDERASLRIVAKRKVRGRTVTARGAVVLSARAGRGDVALAKTLKRLKVLRPGRVTLVVTATDAAGNRSTPRSVRLALRR